MENTVSKAPQEQQQVQKNEVIVSSQEAQAVTVQQSSRANLTLDTAPRYALHVPGGMTDEVISAVQELGKITPENVNTAASALLAVYGAAESRGFDVDVEVRAAPTFDIYIEENIVTDSPEIAIDADFTIEDNQ